MMPFNSTSSSLENKCIKKSEDETVTKSFETTLKSPIAIPGRQTHLCPIKTEEPSELKQSGNEENNKKRVFAFLDTIKPFELINEAAIIDTESTASKKCSIDSKRPKIDISSQDFEMEDTPRLLPTSSTDETSGFSFSETSFGQRDDLPDFVSLTTRSFDDNCSNESDCGKSIRLFERVEEKINSTSASVGHIKNKTKDKNVEHCNHIENVQKEPHGELVQKVNGSNNVHTASSNSKKTDQLVSESTESNLSLFSSIVVAASEMKKDEVVGCQKGECKQTISKEKSLLPPNTHCKQIIEAPTKPNTFHHGHDLSSKPSSSAAPAPSTTSDFRDSQKINSLFMAVELASEELRESEERMKRENCLVTDEGKQKLSDYNFFLTQNIELYQIDKNSTSGRLGLRCIHCSHFDRHITAATFFPSTTGSLASGLGTISARHYFGEKCPCVPRHIVTQLRSAKKTSSAQTRLIGRLGLDAYCRMLSKKIGICDAVNGGIYFSEDMGTKKSQEQGEPNNLQNCEYSFLSEVQDEATKKWDLSRAQEEQNLHSSSHHFIRTKTKYFWECRHCKKLPYLWRSSGSVLFCENEPSKEDIDRHLKKCNGNIPLVIPRNAMLNSSDESSNLTTVSVKWNNTPKTLCSGEDSLSEIRLIYPGDKPYTTEFHYFCVEQLKATHLVKSGGSRSSCPIGYPGLRCIHCDSREFFYTSSDHLRNSFSHIPSHLMECSCTPDHVKQTIESLKLLRNRQKSLLKVGSHKIFIDRVWKRMHQSDDEHYKWTPVEKQNKDTLVRKSCEAEQAKVPKIANQIIPRVESIEVRLQKHMLNNEDILINKNDLTLTSDFVYHALQQVQPYNLTERDVAQGRGNFEVGFPGLVCKYCKHSHNPRKFFNRSAYHLRNAFAKIPDHLMVCSECPDNVKSMLVSFKQQRAVQESELKRGSNITFMDRVWGRLIMFDKSIKPPPRQLSIPGEQTRVGDLVSDEDASLVTEFTFFTMQQMVPCALSMSGNGARSSFEVGFPGLECRHCSGYKNPRRFFYRTAEILGGNYAHIPNHLMSCSKCPLDIKATLESKKEVHLQHKSKLKRGSQRIFFTRVWNRLHSQTQAQAQQRQSQNIETVSTSIQMTSLDMNQIEPIQPYTKVEL